jgi:hypothetical protein
MNDEYIVPIIKRPTFDMSRFEKPAASPLQVRTQEEDLIAQIVAHTQGTEAEKRGLAKRLAITAKIAKWGTAELHALLKKRQDPTIRNYSGFVRWSCKITKAGK